MNNVVKPKSWTPPPVGTNDGNWVWDGTRWVCDPDCEPSCPPPDFSVIRPPFHPPFFPPPVTQPPWYPGANGGVSFSDTPPPNPIRGAFWFNGTSLYLFDGAAWTQVGTAGSPSTGGAAVAVGPTPPQNAQIGALWWDGNALLVWDGVKWDVAGGSTTTGSTPPSNPQPGQQWFNGSTLFIWDGNAWVPTSQTQTFIQPTAPPSPQPGDQWWDGTQMRIWDGHAWELVGPGATVGPVPTSTITFAIIQATNVTTAPSAFAVVPFSSTPQVDTQNAYDPITHRVTPKVAGMYLVEARMLAGSTINGVAIVKNDTGTFTGISSDIVPAISFDSSGGGWVSCTGFVQMNGTTDFLRLWSYNNSGIFAAGGNPCFSCLLMP